MVRKRAEPHDRSVVEDEGRNATASAKVVREVHGVGVEAKDSEASAGGDPLLVAQSIEMEKVGTSFVFRHLETGGSVEIENRDEAAAVRQILETLMPIQGRRRAKTGVPAWRKELLDKGPLKFTLKLGSVSMVPVIVYTHASHPDRFVSQRTKDAVETVAFEIRIGDKGEGEAFGHVLAHSPSRFVVIAPKIQRDRSSHRNLDAASVRVQTLANGWLEREKARGASSKRRRESQSASAAN